MKKFEPLLLVPIGFGALMVNLPLNGLMTPPHGEEIGGLFYYLFHGVRLEIFPPLIFLGLGALTDFGPLLANPKTLLLGGGGPVRRLRRLPRAVGPRLHPARGGLHRHHRRCRRPDVHLPAR